MSSARSAPRSPFTRSTWTAHRRFLLVEIGDLAGPLAESVAIGTGRRDNRGS
jgi:hypothetical protein